MKGGIIHIDYDIEGSDVGYRWFKRTHKKPLFPFGHGLSYTSFDYSELEVSEDEAGVHVSFTIKNIGGRSGCDVAQIYIHPASLRYVSRLAGFKRIELQSGEKKTVNLTLEPKVIAIWDTAKREWQIKPEIYEIHLARNAEETCLQKSIALSAHTFSY